MNLLSNKFLATSLAVGLAALNLPAQNAAQFGNLPLRFEASQPAKFIAHASGAEFAVSPAGAEFTLAKNNGETASGQMQFVGANPAAHITGDQPLLGTVNYLLGNQPGQWRASVPTFAHVRVENIYSGVNVVYYGNRQKLEYDFDLAAGVNPSVIALHFAGAEKISVNPQGELVIRFAAGEVVQHTPVAYQIVQGARQEIAAGYKILDAHTATFDLGQYNHAAPLVIDPVLSFATYYGGNYGETGWAIAVNPTDGSIYVAGQTFSQSDTNNVAGTFSTPGAFQTNYHGGKLTGDAFVARLDASGTNLIYVTYLGGTNDDGALGLAVDAEGNAFVTGFTDSPDFPTTNALRSQINGQRDPHTKYYPVDAFVTEINPAGNALVYSTYLGGASMDAAYGIALDEADNAYVTGYTYSTNFPVTPNAFQNHLACPDSFYINANAFVAEISAGGTNLNYATYLGGTNFDEGHAIAYNNGRVMVAGQTSSTNFPAINALPGLNHLVGVDIKTHQKKNFSFPPDVFVTAFATSVTNLTVLYSTYLGGSNYDSATGIAADANGSAYVCGYTSSQDFPNTATNLANLSNGYTHTNKTEPAMNTNGFLTRIDWNETNATIGYSALFGGHGTRKGADIANGIALDPAGNAYVVGTTSSTNFPVTTNNLAELLTATNAPGKGKKRFSNAFVIAFNTNCSALLYSASLGGDGNDFGHAIAVDPLGNAYLTGQTTSTNFPAVGALQNHRTGTNDLFIAKISQMASPAPSLVIAATDSSPAIQIQSKTARTLPPKNSGLTLKWQMFPANYYVESSTDLTPRSWRTVPANPAYSNGWYHVTLPTTNGVQFFRLRQR